MKRTPVVVAASLLVSTAGFGAVEGTAHDLSGQGLNPTSEVCVFCHTPHGAIPVVPLWNHTLSTESYSEYSSPTLQAESAPAPLQNSTGVSNLCLSCHDGSVALSMMVNIPPTGDPEIGLMGAVSANLGTDLSNDHPINIVYDAALVARDPELALPGPGGANLPRIELFGPGANEVQCASCHDPHDDSIRPFLVKSTAGSALCLVCHLK